MPHLPPVEKNEVSSLHELTDMTKNHNDREVLG